MTRPIDLNRLEEEWANQPGLYRRAARLLTKAKRDLDHAEDKLEVITAQTSLKIRKHPEAYLGDEVNITEDGIKSAVRIDPNVLKARREVINAKYVVGLAVADVKSLEHRKDGIGDEVKLWLGSYFATPWKPSSDQFQEKSKEVLNQSAARSARVPKQKKGTGQ